MKSFRAGQRLHGLPPRERFKRLISELNFEDRFGVPDVHWIAKLPGQRLRVGRRRLGMGAASWTIFRGEIHSGFTARPTCGAKSCCNPEHLRLVLR